MLSADEKALVAKLHGRLGGHGVKNKVKADYYAGDTIPHYVGLTIPPQLHRLAPHMGWAGVVVDALDERLGFLGWNDPAGGLGLDRVYNDNRLAVESGLGHLDALIFGTAFVAVAVGGDGEPDPLVTVHSPNSTTGVWDGRARRLSSALIVDDVESGQPETATLNTETETIVLERRSGTWAETDRWEHKAGRTPVVMLSNRISASLRHGQSEINKPVRDLIDEASRVLLSMAVNREFFSSPQRIVLGASPDDVDKWKALTTGIWTIEPDAEGDLPTVTQFPAVAPGAHIEQLKALATQLAATAGVPEAYFGVAATANPSSADAIRAAEVRLIKKAERRAAMFGTAWLDVAELAVRCLNGGALPEQFRDVSCRWADPATPTRAAKADEAAKLVGAGVLAPRGQVVYDRIGLTPAEQAQAEADWERSPSTGDVLAAMVRQAE